MDKHRATSQLFSEPAILGTKNSFLEDYTEYDITGPIHRARH